MKILISRLDLVALASRIQTIVPSRPSTPILSNVLIEAVDDQLILSATDLTVSARTFTNAEVVQEGAVVLPARQLFQLIREIPSPMIEMHVSPTGIATLNAGSSRFKIHGMQPQEFPLLPHFSGSIEIEFSSVTLKELLGRTSFAAARDLAKPILQSVCLQWIDQTWTFLSTDGKRIATMHTEYPAPSEDHARTYVIPLKAIDEIVRLLDEKEEKVRLCLLSDKIALETGSVTLMTKLLSGHYPDVARILPQRQASPLLLHREELISLLRQVILFTSEKGCSVKFSFTSGELRLCASDSALGEGTVAMPVNYEGERLDIAFNPHFVLDALRHIKDETIQLHLIDPYNPGLITDSTTAQFMIMPMRLDAYVDPVPAYATSEQ